MVHKPKLYAFLGGVAATILGSAVVKSKQVRKLAVNGVAKGMIVKANAEEAMQSVKDDAEDLVADAKQEARIDAELAEKRIEIEKRVRKQVEEEMKKEEEKAHQA